MPLLLSSLAAAAILGSGDEVIGSRREYIAKKLSSAPVIDGDISDDVWKDIPELTGFYDRKLGRVAEIQTKAKLAYDDKFIYIAFHCFEPDADKIRARETQEDSFFNNQSGDNGEDAFAVSFDPYLSNSERDESTFLVTPLGTKSVRFGSGRANKREWKGEWVAKVKKGPDGWYGEIQIPWANLNYPAGSNKIMGFNMARIQDHLKLTTHFSNIGDPGRIVNQGRWVGVDAPPAPRPKVQMLAYALPGYDDKDRPTFRSGLDMRYAITQDLTAVASINPDFGTIEGAVEGISFSRSERFLPEKRPFFQEGQSYFSAGGNTDIGVHFYPRRIRTFDLGTKLYGKINTQDSIGILHTISFGERSDVVAKWNHQWSDKQSFNLFVNNKTSRQDEGSVLSANYFQRWGKFFVDPRGAQSSSNGNKGRALNIGLGYEDKNNFTYVVMRDYSRDFRLPDGLMDFTGYRGFMAFNESGMDWRSGPIRRAGTEVVGFLDWKYGNKLFRRGGSAFGYAITKSDIVLEAGLTHQWFEDQLDNYIHLGAAVNHSNRTRRYGLFADFGQLSNSPYTFYGTTVSQRVGKVDLSSQTGFLNLNGHDIQSILTASYEFSPTRSMGGRMVERNGRVNWYLSYRESGKKGNEIFVILGDPNTDKFRRVAQIKMVFPFQLG